MLGRIVLRHEDATPEANLPARVIQGRATQIPEDADRGLSCPILGWTLTNI